MELEILLVFKHVLKSSDKLCKRDLKLEKDTTFPSSYKVVTTFSVALCFSDEGVDCGDLGLWLN